MRWKYFAFAIGLSCFVLGASSPAEMKVACERNRPEEASPEFRFREVPPPAADDDGAKAKLWIAEGRRDPNSGDLESLVDGRVPSEEDEPRENFFFAAGTEGGRVVLDLGSAIEVREVRTYSWHPNARGPQVYKLYASGGTAEGFDERPGKGVDPAARGWRLLATVDTRPKEDRGGGQHGVRISESGGALGTYRYLLFDASRTEGDDPFGNTFYSEIDVVGPRAPAALAKPRERPEPIAVEAEGGKYRIEIDASETPDLAEWAKEELAPVVRVWYPKIAELLASEGFTAPARVRIAFRAGMGGVAATSGARIQCAASWYRANLKGEAKGSVVHELVHVVQQYGSARRARRDAAPPPGWLVEGIADYIRWFLYEPETRGAEVSRAMLPRVRYDAGYRVSANFIRWVTETYDREIVRKLNAALREGRYRAELWKDSTGRTLEELGDEWKKSLEKRLSAGG